MDTLQKFEPQQLAAFIKHIKGTKVLPPDEYDYLMHVLAKKHAFIRGKPGYYHFDATPMEKHKWPRTRWVYLMKTHLVRIDLCAEVFTAYCGYVYNNQECTLIQPPVDHSKLCKRCVKVAEKELILCH